MPLTLNEDSEFNLVIVINKEKDIPKTNKILIYQCERCKNKGISPPDDSSLIYLEEIDEAERVPKTPSKVPFSNRNDNLSFKEVLGFDKSPILDRNSSPSTTRSQFDFNFFQPNLFFGNILLMI